MSGKAQRIIALVLCALCIFSIAAARAEYGPNEGTIRGAAFVDSNKNGKMDSGESGLGWVYFTISNGDYSHTYHSEWQTVDSAGNKYATGYFGPAPLAKGGWKVTLHVPQGYVATTPIEQVVYVPGAEGGHVAYVYLGLYPTKGGAGGILPASGVPGNYVLLGALAFLGIGVLISVSLGVAARRRP
jgi:hypothetical protein